MAEYQFKKKRKSKVYKEKVIQKQEVPHLKKRVDKIKKLENKAQQLWEKEKIFEVDAPKDDEAQCVPKYKYLATFPYPYMDGCLHLGHTFSLLMAEIAVGYERLQGKQCLLPIAFHCTGMPMMTNALKLAEYTTSSFEHKQEIMDIWKELKSMGLEDEEIQELRISSKWLDFFPDRAKVDIKSLGCRVDWRRSFITTDANPYYDSFVRWQFNYLKEQQKVKGQQSERVKIISTTSGKSCDDDKRKEGVGIVPQNYNLIKMEMMKPYPEKFSSHPDKPIFLVAATSYKKECMCHLTNCWIYSDMNYIAFEACNNEVFICSERAANNMSYQGFTEVYGSVHSLLSLSGKDIIGLPLKPPSFVKLKTIYTLPYINSNSKGIRTGIDLSIPSVDDMDKTALKDLQSDNSLRSECGIKDEMLMLAYTPDQLPKKAKERTRKQNDEKESEVLQYWEPQGKVTDNKSNECVAALCNIKEWCLDYENPTWKRQVEEKLLPSLNVFPDDDKKLMKNLESTVKGLQNHSFSRTFGHGTQIPWDKEYRIDGVSDSTVLAYCTVAHLLDSAIRVDQLTKEVWEYIFVKGELPRNCPIDTAILRKLREEFMYWYPVDLRISGKELIESGSPFCYLLFNHVALWPNESSQWPKAVRVHGHVVVSDEEGKKKKMSKSNGNIVTLREAVEKYSADGVRLALAKLSGDHSKKNVQFNTYEANSCLMQLYSLRKWAKRTIRSKDNLRNSLPEKFTYHDRVFDNEMKHLVGITKESYAHMLYNKAIQTGFYKLQDARKRYCSITSGVTGDNQNWWLIEKYIEIQALLLCPVCPHFAENIWTVLLKKEESIMRAHWPEMSQLNTSLLRETEYFTHICSLFQTKTKKQKVDIQSMYGVIYVYPLVEWWQVFLEEYRDKPVEPKSFKPLFDLKSKRFLNDIPTLPELRKMVADCSLIDDETLLFNEKEAIFNNIHFLTEVLDLKEMWIEELSKEKLATLEKKGIMPFQPYLELRTSPHKQPVEVTVVNPMVVPIYDGDTYSSVVARIRRTKHALDQENVLRPPCNLRLKKSAAEADYQDVDEKTCFGVENKALFIGDGAQRIPLSGTHMEYAYSDETEK